MHGPVVRLGALHVRERAHGAAEPLLEPELRDDDLPRRLVDLEVRERAVPDPVRLDADAARLELGDLGPVERPVDDAARREVLVVRQRAALLEVADRDEQHGGIAVPLEDRHRVLEVVEIAVVERDQHRARRQRQAA